MLRTCSFDLSGLTHIWRLRGPEKESFHFILLVLKKNWRRLWGSIGLLGGSWHLPGKNARNAFYNPRMRNSWESSDFTRSSQESLRNSLGTHSKMKVAIHSITLTSSDDEWKDRFCYSEHQFLYSFFTNNEPNRNYRLFIELLWGWRSQIDKTTWVHMWLFISSRLPQPYEQRSLIRWWILTIQYNMHILGGAGGNLHGPKKILMHKLQDFLYLS